MIDHYRSDLPVPSVPFDGDTPTLRTLVFSNCPVPWHSFKRNSLTTLLLRHDFITSEQKLGEFLALLSCMQELAQLCLSHFLSGSRDFNSSAALSNVQKINFPKLSLLEIKAPLSTVVAFLSCVNIPSQTEVYLCCIHEYDLFPFSPDDYALLPLALAQRYKLSED